MIVHEDIFQQSDEWADLRKGLVTATKAHTLLVDGKGAYGFGAGALTLSRQLAQEIITGMPFEAWGGNQYTDYGMAEEVNARELYSRLTLSKVHQVGFVTSKSYNVLKRCGFSPDGLVKTNNVWIKGVEFKCLPKEHVIVLASGTPKAEHVTQCQFSMWVSGLREWDLVYYNDLFMGDMRMIRFQLKADPEVFMKLEERMPDFYKLIADQIRECRKTAQQLTIR